MLHNWTEIWVVPWKETQRYCSMNHLFITFCLVTRCSIIQTTFCVKTKFAHRQGLSLSNLTVFCCLDLWEASFIKCLGDMNFLGERTDDNCGVEFVAISHLIQDLHAEKDARQSTVYQATIMYHLKKWLWLLAEPVLNL